MADRQYSVEGDRGREAGQGNGGKRELKWGGKRERNSKRTFVIN